MSEDVEVEETEIDAEDAVRRVRERRARARKGGGDRPRRVGARRGDRSIARAGGGFGDVTLDRGVVRLIRVCFVRRVGRGGGRQRIER